MTSLLRSLAETLRADIAQYRNRSFLQAAMAAGALVALADGAVTLAERHRIDQILERIDQLRIFDVHEAVDLFDTYVDALRADPESGKVRALDVVHALAEDPKAARLLLLRICIAVSGADGRHRASERARITEIAAALDLSPGDCGAAWQRAGAPPPT